MRGRFLNVQHQAVMQQFLQPVFVAGAMARLDDAVTILAEHDHGKRQVVGAGENGNRPRIIVGRCGQGVGIEDHSQTSRSICSKASSTRFSICFLSLWRCLSFPRCFIQGFSWEVIFSFSWTASVTSWRRGIPRWAAADLARRKRKSGISRVVFMDSHITIFMGYHLRYPFLYRTRRFKPRRADGTARESVW